MALTREHQADKGKGKGKAKAAAPAAKRGPKGPTGGAGKRAKVFSESLGVAHLVALSSDIAGETASRDSARLQRSKASDEHRRAKRRSGQQEKEARADASTALVSRVSLSLSSH